MRDRLIVVIGGSAVVLVGSFGLLWVVFDNAKTAATVLVSILAVLGSFCAGMMAMYLGTRRTVSHMADVLRYSPPAEQINVSQLPSRGLVSVDEHTYLHSDRIADNAGKIMLLMYPSRLPLTRESIMQATDLRSHGEITSALDYLSDLGHVSEGIAGREREWLS